MNEQEAIAYLKTATNVDDFVAKKKEVLEKLTGVNPVHFRATIESEGLIVKVLGKDTSEDIERSHQRRKVRKEEENLQELLEELI
jgi:hypothetical protein